MLARELARKTSGRVLSKDEFRHAIFLPEEIEYSSHQDDFCLRLMLQTAEYLLSRDPARIMFLDGRPFSRRYQIDNVLTVASSLHQSWRILECLCSEDTARKRLAADADASSHPAGNRNFQLFAIVKSRFETITHPKIVIDTDKTLEQCINRSLIALGRDL